MATTKFGEIELDDAELAQMGKTAFETLGPTARTHDVPHLANSRSEQGAIDRDFAEMARMIIAAFMAKGGSSKKAARARR